MQWTDFIKSVDRKFVQCNDVIALRICCFALHTTKVTDVVVDILSIFYLTGFVVPSDNLTVHIE